MRSGDYIRRMPLHKRPAALVALILGLSAACGGGSGGLGAVSCGFGGSKEAVAAPPDVAAPPTDATKTASGLASRVLKPGTGTAHPDRMDRVLVHYTGWTTDGAMFDSSVARGEPIAFRLSEVIPGWTEGVHLMVEGERRRLWIPEQLAYAGQPGQPAGMLVFDVELIKINP
jgi:FKBP-type peptidyl-prolyl cis-trans isomerase